MTATITSIALFAAFCAAAWGVGDLFLRRVRSALLPGENVVFAVPLGMGAIGILVLAIGLLRVLQTGVLAALLTLLAIGGASSLVYERRRRENRAQALASHTSGVFGMTVALLLGILGLCTLVAALAPPGGLDYDGLVYHFGGPKTYLREGRIFFIPYDHHTNFPFLLQMLYTLMLGLGSMGGAKLCHWMCGVLLAASVYTFAVRHIAPVRVGRAAGLVAALLLASTPIVLWEARSAYVDLASALFTWLSLYALINAAQVAAAPATGERASVSWLLVSAVLMGFALGTKYTVLGFWGMLLIGVLGWHYATTRRWAKETLPHAALWGAVALLVGLPWYLKTFFYTGSPVYPFYYGVFGGRYWNADNALKYTLDQAKFGVGKTPVDLLLGPWRATMEAALLPTITPPRPFIFTEYVLFGLSPVLLALALAAPLLARRLSRTAVYLALFSLGVYVFWFFLMQQTRYLIPALPALALIGGEALVRAWDEKQLKIAPYLGSALAAASALWGIYVAGVFLAAPAVPVIFGQIAPLDYVATTGVGMRGLIPAVRFINETTPKTAKVVLFNEPRGFYLNREFAWGESAHAFGLFPWDTYRNADDWLADWKRRGYTVLLVGPSAPDVQDGEKFRTLLPEAEASGKVVKAFDEGRGYAVYLLQ